MEFLKNMLSESGTISSMRVMSLIALLFSGVIAVYGMSKNNIDYSGLTMLSGVFVGVAFTGKVMQKRVEQKPDEIITTESKNE